MERINQIVYSSLMSKLAFFYNKAESENINGNSPSGVFWKAELWGVPQAHLLEFGKQISCYLQLTYNYLPKIPAYPNKQKHYPLSSNALFNVWKISLFQCFR